MKFSLVVCTVDRSRELAELLASLDVQWYREFEVIVVDQNADARVAPILAPYADRFPIRHIRSMTRGASRARNAGAAEASGDVIAFPDDDCTYPLRVLEQVRTLLQAHPEWDVVTGRTTGDPYPSRTTGPVTQMNVWKRGIEYAMFFRRHVIEKVGLMDETIGPGTIWGAGEGTDYLLRAIEAGFRVHYVPSLEIDHPRVEQPFAAYIEKSYRYAMAKGRVLRIRNSPSWMVVYQCCRPIGGIVTSLLCGEIDEARVYWAVAKGIRRGAMSS